jgi:hypothetical protein
MRLSEQWSFTTFLSGALLVFGAWVASHRKTVRGALVALVAAFSVAGWARPENCTAALIVLAIASVATARAVVVGAVALRRAALELGAALVPGAILCAIFGWPLGGGRSFYAFGQHYSWNVVQREHLDVNPWSDWLTYVHRDFGDVTTVGQAFSRNPSAFLAHVASNLHEYPRAFAGVAAPMLGFPPKVELLLQVVSVVALVAGLVGALVRVREARTSPALAVAYVAFLSAFATNALSAVLVYPRPHYLVPVVALAMPLVARGLRLSRRRGAGVPESVAPPLAAWVVLLALAPNLAHGWTPYAWLAPKLPRSRDVYRVRTIERLQALGLRGPVVSLEPEWGYAFLAGIPFERYAQWDKDRPFDEFVQAHGIDLIVVDYTLRNDERFRDDPEFARFVADPSRLGFQVFPVDGVDACIAVRRGTGAGS